MKLLIVDDSAMVRRAVSSVYQDTIFTEIETASDGMLALTIFKKFQPDVVTLDITMPHMDGLAALVQMLKFKPKTQVLVISALADQYTAVEALKRGASQFICKPFTEAELKEALDDLLEDIENDDEAPYSFGEGEESETTSVFSFGSGSESSGSNAGFSFDAENDEEEEFPVPEAYPSGFVPAPKISVSIDEGDESVEKI